MGTVSSSEYNSGIYHHTPTPQYAYSALPIEVRFPQNAHQCSRVCMGIVLGGLISAGLWAAILAVLACCIR